MLTSLSVGNFTAFEDGIDIGFFRRVNILISDGPGWGTTHLLKLGHAVGTAACMAGVSGESLGRILMNLFRPDSLGHLVSRYGTGREPTAWVSASWGGRGRLSFSISPRAIGRTNPPTFVPDSRKPGSVFVPAGEILTLLPDIGDMRRLDGTHAHLARLLEAPSVDGLPPTMREIRDFIASVAGCRARMADGRPLLFHPHEKRPFEASLMSREQLRLETVGLLVGNGTIHEGTILWWDEPDAGLPPTMVMHLSRLFAKFADAGVHVVAATHSRAFLGELREEFGDAFGHGAHVSNHVALFGVD